MKIKNWDLTAHYGFFRAEGGWCAAAWTPKGLSALILPQKSKAIALRLLNEYLPPTSEPFWKNQKLPVPPLIQQLTNKALKGKTFKPPAFDLSFLTPFQQRIILSTCQIPKGQYRTYGWVAGKAGSPKGFRAAGQALHRNPVPLLIPCHRIVAGGNRLGGYGGGLDWKIRLLQGEGVHVSQGYVDRVGKTKTN